MSSGHVSAQYDSGIATITFSAPPHNSMSSTLLQELAGHILSAGTNNAAQVIVLRSDGDRTFCAGANLREMMDLKTAEEGKAFFMGVARVILAIRNAGCIVICRVQGKAIGGGLGIAATADYCFASRFAAVKLSELSIGIGPFVIEPAVSRKIGLAAFTQLSINPQSFFDASWAQQHGLFAEVFEETAAMDAAIDRMVTDLRNMPPELLAAYKQMLWEGTVHWEQLLPVRAEVSGNLAISTFTRENLEKFFTGK